MNIVKFFKKPTKTISSVLAAFTVAINDLKAVGDGHINQATYHAEEAKASLATSQAHEMEATRALAIAKKMESVFA